MVRITRPIDIERYATRVERDGTSTIFDNFTNWPADYLGRPLDGLQGREAVKLCVVMNALYRHRIRTIDREIKD